MEEKVGAEEAHETNVKKQTSGKQEENVVILVAEMLPFGGSGSSIGSLGSVQSFFLLLFIVLLLLQKKKK